MHMFQKESKILSQHNVPWKVVYNDKSKCKINLNMCLLFNGRLLDMSPISLKNSVIRK